MDQLIYRYYESQGRTPASSDQPDDPRYNEEFWRYQSIYDAATHRLTTSGPKTILTQGGYPGAPAAPENFIFPTDTPLDAYTVPTAGQPGYIAGKEGQYVTVYHNGQGGLRYEYADVCDLVVKNVVGHAPTVAGGMGSVEFEATTSAAWISASLVGQNLEGAPGTPLVQVAPGRLAIRQVPAGTYALVVTDERQCSVGLSPLLLVTVPASPAAVVYGCMDEDATNYNPAATQDDGTCRYSPRFVGLWSNEGIPVSVVPIAGQAYVTGELFAGYVSGHPLAAARPEVSLGMVRATVSPRTGLATFNLAPYLQEEVGALLLDGSRRLDLNAPTAATDDLLVGYRLRVAGKPIATGYALNSVLTEAQLDAYDAGKPLSAFGNVLPVWASYPYQVSRLGADASGKFGMVHAVSPQAAAQRIINMPCPRHGLPVAWLSPEGGFGYWVFSGQPVHGDEVGEGQPYNEAGTQELRYSSRAASRATVEAYSGVFSEKAFVEGLRTLRRAVQAWYQPEGPGTEWVAITLKGGSYPAYREGRRRYEATISFTEARPQLVQGQ